jgi:predicted ribosome quality control (RQC) complex YloA/Tae2 family protein
VHCNYYFLRQLTQALDKRLASYYVASCFSQNKDELVIELNNGHRSFFIKAHLLPQFSCLSFPESFNRAKKNSVDLFPEIILRRFLGVKQYQNERSFALEFESGYHLIFKMHGHRANVLLNEGGQVKNIFKNELKADLDIAPDRLDRELDWSKTYFLAHREQIRSKYFTWGREVWDYLNEKEYESLQAEVQWKLIRETKQMLENPTYSIVRKGENLVFTLLPSKEVVATLDDPIKAINEFFALYISNYALINEKATGIKRLNQLVKSGVSFIAKNETRLHQIKNDLLFKLWADTIMSHLHEISTGSSEVTLANYSDNNNLITIPLKPELNAQKNAEIYYRKSKNKETEIKKLEEALTAKEHEIKKYKALIRAIEGAEGLLALRGLLSAKKGTKPKKEEGRMPFRKVECKGFQIWIGKNAASNDELTLKYSHKDDLWLHAKDVAGSHVLIKFQAGKKFPKDVIERAAQLAAYHSRRKNESLCPVAYTLKKHVRKRKGDPPGVVVVERENVILVAPQGVD